MPAAGPCPALVTIGRAATSRGERASARADGSGVQRIRLTVKGGYTPDVIVLKRGVPLDPRLLDGVRDAHLVPAELLTAGPPAPPAPRRPGR